MARELVVTSAPRGVKLGRTGFQVVMRTAGLREDVTEALEKLGDYRHVHPAGSGRNPTIYAFRRVRTFGGELAALVRSVDAGHDFSSRSNKLTHVVALDSAELAGLQQASPPALLRALDSQGLLASAWPGEPEERPAGPRLPSATSLPRRCSRWAEQAGDAGWAGVIAERALRGAPTLVVAADSSPASSQILLDLFEEVYSLLPPSRRWEIPFETTLVATNSPAALRGTYAGSPESATPGTALLVDLAARVPVPLEFEGSDLVSTARTGSARRVSSTSQAGKGPHPAVPLPVPGGPPLGLPDNSDPYGFDNLLPDEGFGPPPVPGGQGPPLPPPPGGIVPNRGRGGDDEPAESARRNPALLSAAIVAVLLLILAIGVGVYAGIRLLERSRAVRKLNEIVNQDAGPEAKPDDVVIVEKAFWPNTDWWYFRDPIRPTPESTDRFLKKYRGLKPEQLDTHSKRLEAYRLANSPATQPPKQVATTDKTVPPEPQSTPEPAKPAAPKKSDRELASEKLYRYAKGENDNKPDAKDWKVAFPTMHNPQHLKLVLILDDVVPLLNDLLRSSKKRETHLINKDTFLTWLNGEKDNGLILSALRLFGTQPSYGKPALPCKLSNSQVTEVGKEQVTEVGKEVQLLLADGLGLTNPEEQTRLLQYFYSQLSVSFDSDNNEKNKKIIDSTKKLAQQASVDWLIGIAKKGQDVANTHQPPPQAPARQQPSPQELSKSIDGIRKNALGIKWDLEGKVAFTLSLPELLCKSDFVPTSVGTLDGKLEQKISTDPKEIQWRWKTDDRQIRESIAMQPILIRIKDAAIPEPHVVWIAPAKRRYRSDPVNQSHADFEDYFWEVVGPSRGKVGDREKILHLLKECLNPGPRKLPNRVLSEFLFKDKKVGEGDPKLKFEGPYISRYISKVFERGDGDAKGLLDFLTKQALKLYPDPEKPAAVGKAEKERSDEENHIVEAYESDRKEIEKKRGFVRSGIHNDVCRKYCEMYVTSHFPKNPTIFDRILKFEIIGKKIFEAKPGEIIEMKWLIDGEESEPFDYAVIVAAAGKGKESGTSKVDGDASEAPVSEPAGDAK